MNRAPIRDAGRMRGRGGGPSLSTLALVVVLALPLLGCEVMGAPLEYKAKVCAAVAELSGPLPSAVAAAAGAVTARDSSAAATAVGQTQASIDRMQTDLTDVPLWQTGAPAVADLRAIVGAYRAALAELRAALGSNDWDRTDAAIEQLNAAREAVPNLGADLRSARVVGLNC